MQRAQAELGQILAEIGDAGAERMFGYTRLSEWLQDTGHFNSKAAEVLCERAVALNPRMELGQPVPALAPLTGAAPSPAATNHPVTARGHHIVHWDDGRPTNLANLVLLCEHHHRVVHRAGWDIQLAPDGIPEFLPPTFVDPRRKPRRNNIHTPIAV